MRLHDQAAAITCMDCPRCHERLRSDAYRAQPYRVCFYCEGAWVPKDALAAAGVPDVHSREGSQAQDQCPSCSLVLLLGEIEDVEVEYCPGCWAVWFDKGELERVATEYKGETDWAQVSADARGIRAFVWWLRAQMRTAKIAIDVAKRVGGS